MIKRPSISNAWPSCVANDWGLWRTTTMNLEKVRLLSQGYEQLTDEQKRTIDTQVKIRPGAHGEAAQDAGLASAGSRR